MEQQFLQNSAAMETLHKDTVMETAPHEDKVKDGLTKEEMDPWNPPYPPQAPVPPAADLVLHIKLAKEWMAQTRAILATSRATNIIAPDRTPQWVNFALFCVLPRLMPILEKDSYRRFLSLFERNGGGMGWGYVITPETFDQIIVKNALQCAKVALKGQAPELDGFRANPNYMTQYGYFPLHRAAEMFSVEMIELLLRHGASANLSTAGPVVAEGLLPLHVAVENTCLHKYLEDSLFHDQKHQDGSLADANYVYKLIHLLCLPELKIFMDTIRLLAKHTDNLLDQLWNYIKDGKLTHTAVLLLAAQEHIRMGTSHKRKVDSKMDGFTIITSRIGQNIALQFPEACENIMDPNQPRKRNINGVTLFLVEVISRAGEALDSYIRAHPKVPYLMQAPHSEVLERVSLILKEHGFSCTGGRIDIGNLCPYKNVLSNEDLRTLEGMVATKSATEVGFHAVNEKGPIKKMTRGWEHKYATRSFFPYERSVLERQLSAKMSSIKPMLTVEQINHDRGLSKSTGIGSTFGRLMGRVPQPIANHQPRRLFGTVALTLLKVLKNA